MIQSAGSVSGGHPLRPARSATPAPDIAARSVAPAGRRKTAARQPARSARAVLCRSTAGCRDMGAQAHALLSARGKNAASARGWLTQRATNRLQRVPVTFAVTTMRCGTADADEGSPRRLLQKMYGVGQLQSGVVRSAGEGS